MASKKAATMANAGSSNARSVESRRELIPNPRRRTGDPSATTVKDTRSRTLPTEKDKLEAAAVAKRDERFSPKKLFSRGEGSAYKILTHRGRPSKKLPQKMAKLRPSKEKPVTASKETATGLNDTPMVQFQTTKATQACIAQKDKICETKMESADVGTSSTGVIPILVSRSSSPGRLDSADSCSSIEPISDTLDTISVSQEDSSTKDTIVPVLTPVLIALPQSSTSSPHPGSPTRNQLDGDDGTVEVSAASLGKDPRRFSLKFFRSSRRLTETKLKELRDGLHRRAFFWSRESYRRQLAYMVQEEGRHEMLFDTAYPLVTPTADDIEDMFNSRQPKGLDGHRAPPNSPSIETLKSLKSFLTVSREPPDVIELGLFPVRTACPKCHRNIVTKTSRRMGKTVYWAACTLCLVFPPLAIVPFFATAVYDVQHKCPRCGFRIGVFYP